MPPRFLPRLLVPALFLLVPAGAAAAPSQHATTYKVTSTLDGKKVLPRRIVWTVNVSPAFPKSGLVDFLIDDKTVGFNYIKTSDTYPDTGGYLVTTWLKPGTHTFTSRVRPPGSQVTIDDTVIATTVAPAAPPAALAGTWERTVSDLSGTPKPGSAGNPGGNTLPTGRYELIFDTSNADATVPSRCRQAVIRICSIPAQHASHPRRGELGREQRPLPVGDMPA